MGQRVGVGGIRVARIQTQVVQSILQTARIARLPGLAQVTRLMRTTG